MLTNVCVLYPCSTSRACMLLSTKGISIQKVLKRLPNHFAPLHQILLCTPSKVIKAGRMLLSIINVHNLYQPGWTKSSTESFSLKPWRHILPAHTDQFVAVGTFSQSHGVDVMACQHTPPPYVWPISARMSHISPKTLNQDYFWLNSWKSKEDLFSLA